MSEPESHEYYNYFHIAGSGNRVILYLYNKSDPGAQNKVFYSTNSGSNWTEDYDFIKRVDDMSNIGNVMNFVAHDNTNTSASYKTFFHVKEMPITGQCLFDNITQSSTIPFYVNDFTGSTTTTLPGNYSLLGGTINYSVGGNTVLSSPERIFYKWQNGSTLPSSSDYVVDENYNIKVNYKTKNISTDNTAISKSASTKSLKESHGNIDRIQTSIGGVFFSRSTNNGSTFSREEVVNDNWGKGPTSFATTNNINPYLAEVKTILSGGVDAGKNSAVVWERRDGNNINIMYSEREVIGSYGVWGMDELGVSGGNSFSVDVTGHANFECLPKLSVIKSDLNDNRFTVISYLKPDGSSYKLMARVHVPGQTPQDRVISAGNISDFAIYSKPRVSSNGHDIYYAFLRDNHVFYKTESFYVYGSTFVTDSTAQTKISSGDGNITMRYTPDISLKNGLPIITYQGKYTAVRVKSMEDANANTSTPSVSTVTFYPIVVRFLTSTGWTGFINQSSGSNFQSEPNVEGCTTGDSYILNYKKSNVGYCQFTGLQGYHCDPPLFEGTDAKLVRGSYTSPVSTALMTTLNSENSLYRLDKQNVSVTNMTQYQDNYNNVKGVINMNSTDYVFSLGPILIQRDNSIEDNEAVFSSSITETLPSTGVEFNEYMRSEPFVLRNGDTLILGTNAIYKDYKGLEFHPLVYRVNLMNSETDEVVKELFNDTVNVEDTSVTEFYRGYVMSRLGDGITQYYIQTSVEDLSNTDAIYTFGGIYEGDEPIADRGGHRDITNGIYVDFKNSKDIFTGKNIKPDLYSLYQNYPNPFNPSTTIKYSIPKDGLVKLRVYGISGREVANLINEIKAAGNYEVRFNGANLSSGMYFYRIESNDFIETKKMILIK